MSGLYWTLRPVQMSGELSKPADFLSGRRTLNTVKNRFFFFQFSSSIPEIFNTF